ncbi:MAG: HAD hydrolase family protein [Candidatus Sumerlaeota bacterium]
MAQDKTPLFVSDLDGTLLSSRPDLSGRSRETLNRLVEGGALFTAASARAVPSMRLLLQGLRLRLPVIGFNGGLISDLETGVHQTILHIDSDVARAIHERLNTHGAWPALSTFDGECDNLYFGPQRNEGMDYYAREREVAGDARLRRVDDTAVGLSERLLGFTSIAPIGELDQLVEELQGDFGPHIRIQYFEDIYLRGWKWLMIHHHRATKDRAIDALIASRPELADRPLVVFGDHDNDIPMFRRADYAVALKNAQDNVKAEADEIIGSNDADSVALFIEQALANGFTEKIQKKKRKG